MLQRASIETQSPWRALKKLVFFLASYYLACSSNSPYLDERTLKYEVLVLHYFQRSNLSVLYKEIPHAHFASMRTYALSTGAKEIWSTPFGWIKKTFQKLRLLIFRWTSFPSTSLLAQSPRSRTCQESTCHVVNFNFQENLFQRKPCRLERNKCAIVHINLWESV